MSHVADVFVSYSREDKDRVAELAGKLRESGVSIWIDQGGIDGAALWSEEIVRALDSAKVLLLMVSERSVSSHNVIKEVTLASERKGHILPVHLEPTSIPMALKYPLAGIQHIEYFAAGPEEGTKSILRSLERLGVEIKKVDPLASDGGLQHSASHSMDSSAGSSIPNAGIAVLPFENSSPDPDADYFSDGLTDELIASLSQVSDLEVVSRLTSVQYKNTKKDARTIGHELQARYIITGTVRRFQDSLRITAQMVDAQTNKQLWAKTYKGKLDDIFDIQEEVSEQIADALKLKLSVTEKVALTKRSTDNAQAYDLYLRGKEYLYQLSKRSVEYSIQLFEKAIELDPRYASAYAACSNAYGMLYTRFRREEELKERAQQLSLKALMYDNSSADAYAALGLSYYNNRQFDEAVDACHKAIELDPLNFHCYWTLGRIHYLTDQKEEALAMFYKTLELKPEFYATYNDIKLTLNSLGRLEEANGARLKMLNFFPTYILQYPDDGRARMHYATNLAEAGRTEEAKKQGQEAVALSPGDPLMLFNAACLFSQMGDAPAALNNLRNAFAAGYENFEWVKRDSDLDSIRNNPEYIELMKGK